MNAYHVLLQLPDLGPYVETEAKTYLWSGTADHFMHAARLAKSEALEVCYSEVERKRHGLSMDDEEELNALLIVQGGTVILP
jgi:hypothetical protein